MILSNKRAYGLIAQRGIEILFFSLTNLILILYVSSVIVSTWLLIL